MERSRIVVLFDFVCSGVLFDVLKGEINRRVSAVISVEPTPRGETMIVV